MPMVHACSGLPFESSRRYLARFGIARMTAGRVRHHRFEQVPGPVWSWHQPAGRAVTGLADGGGVVDGVVDSPCHAVIRSRRGAMLYQLPVKDFYGRFTACS